MSRVGTATGEPVVVKAANDIYTVLAAVGAITAIFGLVVWYVKMNEIFGGIFKSATAVK